MQRVFRFTLAGALALAGLTACGDKNPSGNNGVVQSVTVTPANANINVGDHFTFVATVTATGNADRTVTWSSSDPTVATIDASSGVVTGVKGGNTSIIATSTADPNVKGAASVTVGAVVQPTVTIAAIRQTIPGTGSVPANANNIAGQLDVDVNLDAGTQKVSTISLIMTCGGKDTTVQTQTVSNGDVAPLGADAATSLLTFSFNTAAFDANTGAVAFRNGTCTLKASAVTTSGTVVASSGLQLTLNNADFVSIKSITTTPGTGQVASANGPTGLLWHAGAVNVSAIGVIYTANRSIASATINLVNVDTIAQLGRNTAAVASGGVIATVSGVTPSSGVLSATFPNSTSNATGVGKSTVDGVGAAVTTVDNNGNAGPAAVATVGTFAGTVRLDNLAPDIATTAPTFIPNTQNSQNGWVGKNFIFSVGAGSLTLGSAANDVTAGVAGVDNVVDTTQFAVGASTTFTNFSSVTSLAETSSGSANTLRLRICDALGNCVNTAALGTFGVDLTPPTLSFISGPANQEVFNIDSGAVLTAASAVAFGVTDTSATAGVTASGAATNDLLVSVQGLHPSGASSATTCDLGSSTGTAPNQSCKAGASEAGSFTLPAATLVDGEYTMVVTGVDQAGNTSDPQTIKYYVDLAAPVVAGGVAVPASITTGTSFASSATDNMDVAAGNGFLHYPASAGLSAAISITETGSATPTGVTFDNTLVRSAAVNLTLSTFYRSLEDVLATAGSKPDNAGLRTLDAANTLALNQAVAIPASNVAAGTAFSNTSTTNGITAWAVAADSTTLKKGHSTILTATATAINTTSASPFTRVCFFFAAPSGTEGHTAGPGGSAAGELVLIGCSSSETTTLSGANRLLNYSVTWTPAANLGAVATTIYAIGENSSGGDGLLTTAGGPTVNQ